MGRGIQPPIVQPLLGSARQRQRVQHRASRHHRPRIAPAATVEEEPAGKVGAPQVERNAQRLEPLLQDAEVEIDDIPPREDVGIEGAHPLTEDQEKIPLAFGDRDLGARRVGDAIRGCRRNATAARLARPSAHHDDLAGRPTPQGDGEDLLQVRGRFDVQRENRERRHPRRRRQLRVLVDPSDSPPRLPGPFDSHRAADTGVDQVASDERQVCLEGGEAVGLKPSLQRSGVRRKVQSDAPQRLSVRCGPRACRRAHGGNVEGCGQLAGEQKEVRPRPAVSHHKGLPRGELAEEVHHGSSALEVPGGVEDEPDRHARLSRAGAGSRFRRRPPRPPGYSSPRSWAMSKLRQRWLRASGFGLQASGFGLQTPVFCLLSTVSCLPSSDSAGPRLCRGESRSPEPDPAVTLGLARHCPPQSSALASPPRDDRYDHG